MFFCYLASVVLSISSLIFPGFISDFPHYQKGEIVSLDNSGQKLAAKTAAASLVVYDPKSNICLLAKNENEQRSIASLTKLMTALVFLDQKPDWEAEYIISDRDRREGGRIYLFRGDTVSVKDLFYSSLVASDNSATAALVNSTGLSEEEFVRRMNDKAKALFMFDTNFVDPIGLGDNNISTAKNVAILLDFALDRPEIVKAVNLGVYNFITQNGEEKKLESTDDLLTQNLGSLKLLGGKTGYTNSAGYCFAAKFKQGDKELISVVLGSQDRFSRFEITKDIATWVYENY
jgi:D-alanyl-D-alanine carboxypeptidase